MKERADFPTLAAFGEELERAAQDGAGENRSRSRSRVLAGVAAVLVVVALLGALTGPGRALAERVASIVGIGDDSTIDHASDTHLAASGRGVVIAAGTAPGGPRYEIVAFANEPPPDDRQFVGGSKVATCLSLDFPTIEARGDFSTTCFGAGGLASLHTSGSSDYGPESELGEDARYVISGETSDVVASVRVSYRDDQGNRIEAPVGYGIADDSVLEQIGAEYRGGGFIAFIPDDGAPRGATAGPTVLDSVEATAFDAEGKVVATDHWGRMLAGQREDLFEEACGQLRGGERPAICESVPAPEQDEAPPRGPIGSDSARRLDLLWKGVIAKAEAGELHADVNPTRVIEVMRMALSPSGDTQRAGHQERAVIAMVEKLRAAGDLPPLGTPLPPLPGR